MPSASSGRYQSKLFNFINQQSRRLTKQYDRAVQQVRVATSWAVPVILYPFYVLFQSTRSVVKQLSSSVAPSAPQLPATKHNSQPQTPPDTDTPIQRVLLLVDSLENEQGSEWATPGYTNRIHNNPAMKQAHESLSGEVSAIQTLPSTDKELPCLDNYQAQAKQAINQHIRGIATELASRSLVVVTAENETIDVFNSTQQEALQAQIIEEIAGYWRYQRLAHSQQTENSAVKIASPEVLQLLDSGVAQIESNYLAPASEVAITLSQKSQQLAQQVQKQLNTITFSSPGTDGAGISNSNSKSYALRFQALIWAAVDYFFGVRTQTQFEQTPQTTGAKLPNTPQRKPLPQQPRAKLPSATASAIEDPWLTVDDLFGEANAEELPADAGNSNYLPGNLRCLRRFAPRPSRHQLPHARASISVRKTTSTVVTPTRKLNHSSTTSASNHQTQISSAPKYIEIETRATPTGYVKHPLEQLLEWLDRGMLVLEKKLLKLWQRIQQLWRHK